MSRTESFTVTTLTEVPLGGFSTRGTWNSLPQAEFIRYCLRVQTVATDNLTATGSCSPPTASARPKASAATN